MAFYTTPPTVSIISEGDNYRLVEVDNKYSIQEWTPADHEWVTMRHPEKGYALTFVSLSYAEPVYRDIVETGEQEKLEQDLHNNHMTIDLWNVYTNKIGQASLTVSCYDEQSQHEFYF